MNLVLAMMRRELFCRSRQGRFYLKRMLFVLLGGSLVLSGFLGGAKLGVTTIGVQLFGRVAVFLMIAACFAAPWSAAPSLAQEKEDRTIGVLFLTDVRPWHIVVAKCLALVCVSAVTILSGLPLLILCVGLGGVSIGQVLAGTAVLLAALFLGTCLGVAVSSIARNSKFALAGAIAASVLAFAVLPFVLGHWGIVTRNVFLQDTLLTLVSPFRALRLVIAGESLGLSLGSCAVFLAAGLPLLVGAWLMVPRLAFERKTRGTSSRKFDALCGNPVVWKERVSSMKSRTAWRLCGVTMLASLVAGTVLAKSSLGRSLSYEYSGNVLLFSLAAAGIVSIAIFALAVVGSCAVSFSREKRCRAFELLLLTGLSETEIILGKIWAPVRTCLPWLLTSILAILLLAQLPAAELDNELLLISALCSSVFGCASMCLYLSLRYRSYVAVGLSALLGIPWLLNSLSAVFSSAGAPILIILNLALAYVCLGKLFHRLRQISSGEKAWT